MFNYSVKPALGMIVLLTVALVVIEFGLYLEAGLMFTLLMSLLCADLMGYSVRRPL